MAAQVLSFFQRSPRYAPAPADWGQQELAEFYRVEAALIRAGIRVGTDRGLSDENEPWFIFYRSDDGEVVIHFARIDGEYIIAGPAYEEIARGLDFSALVKNMVERHPLVRRKQQGDNISLHPAALLVAIVGTAFFKTGEARAAETGASNSQSSHSRPVLLSSSSSSGLTAGAANAAPAQANQDFSVQLPVNQAVLVLAAALYASDYGVDNASLDSAARNAIAAAAAALDFGNPVQHVVTGELSTGFGLTPHATVVDNSPVQTVSSVLSLVAILSTLPNVATQSGDAALTSMQHHDLSLAPLEPAPLESANWTVEVRLGQGAVPNVEAVQLVRSVVGDTSAQKITVIEVSKLPDVLADLIARGSHTHVSASEPTPPTTVEPTQPGDSITPPPVDAKPLDPHPVDPTDTGTPPPTPSGPTTPDHSPYASVALVSEFIAYFLAHTATVEIMVRDTQVVIFDARIPHDGGMGIDHLYAMTFDFADGGAIALVGDQSAFLNGGLLV